MADTRLVCLIVAVFLVASSRAKLSSSDGSRDVAELKKLLGAMKRYLHVKDNGLDDRANADRATAHDDVRTFYASCKISALSYYLLDYCIFVIAPEAPGDKLYSSAPRPLLASRLSIG